MSESPRPEVDAVYRERNRLVAFLAGLYPSHMKRHPESDPWEDDWRNIVCVHGPAGQMTWHIHDSEALLFGFLNRAPDPFADCQYDGHSTAEKYQRLAECHVVQAKQPRTLFGARAQAMADALSEVDPEDIKDL